MATTTKLWKEGEMFGRVVQRHETSTNASGAAVFAFLSKVKGVWMGRVELGRQGTTFVCVSGAGGEKRDRDGF